MPNFALVSNGVVDNVIVADSQDWVNQYISDSGLYDVGGIDVTDLVVSPGDIQKADGSFVPPFAIVASKAKINPDGVDASTVTYTDNHPNPLASVDGTVNGQPVTVALTNGSGNLDITSTNSGDTITVVLGTLTAQITVL